MDQQEIDSLVEYALEITAKPKFCLEDFLFKEQLMLARDPARFATAVCSVRAGKTVTCAADLIDTAIHNPNTVGLYITLARSSAKRIIWPDLHKINREFDLGGIPNESDLSFRFPNGSIIYCSGASDSTEIEKFRGLSNVALAYIDESQAFRQHIKESSRKFSSNGSMTQMAVYDLLALRDPYQAVTFMTPVSRRNGPTTPGPSTTILGLNANQVKLLLS